MRSCYVLVNRMVPLGWVTLQLGYNIYQIEGVEGPSSLSFRITPASGMVVSNLEF